jgi:hypothetical protein
VQPIAACVNVTSAWLQCVYTSPALNMPSYQVHPIGLANGGRRSECGNEVAAAVRDAATTEHGIHHLSVLQRNLQMLKMRSAFARGRILIAARLSSHG